MARSSRVRLKVAQSAFNSVSEIVSLMNQDTNASDALLAAIACIMEVCNDLEIVSSAKHPCLDLLRISPSLTSRSSRGVICLDREEANEIRKVLQERYHSRCLEVIDSATIKV